MAGAALHGEKSLWEALQTDKSAPHPLDAHWVNAEQSVISLVESVLGVEAMTLVRLAILGTASAVL